MIWREQVASLVITGILLVAYAVGHTAGTWTSAAHIELTNTRAALAVSERDDWQRAFWGARQDAARYFEMTQPGADLSCKAVF